MLLFKRSFYFILILFSSLFLNITFAYQPERIPILCYHNFNPSIPGSMNLTPQRFEMQLRWLKDNGYTIIPLKEAVEYLQGTRASLAEKPVVITIDDGWKSAYTYAFPIIKKYNIPVTLFIYPETISNGKNTLTWEQLKELQASGLVDIEGHTYSHPNFKIEKRSLSPANYEKFVKGELEKSKNILENKLGTKITLLAWPFGIYDNYLEQAAKDSGYTMAFSIDAHTANKTYRPMSQPRFMILQDQTMKTFENSVKGLRDGKPKKN